MNFSKLTATALFLIGLFAFTSCSDNDTIDNPEASTIVGEWNVDNASATAYIDGYKIEDLQIATRGTITYLSNGQGVASFLMEFEGESSRIDGSFNWRDTGFEIVWEDFESDEEIRWTKDVDEKNRKVMTFTHELEDDSNDELEITATLTRMN